MDFKDRVCCHSMMNKLTKEPTGMRDVVMLPAIGSGEGLSRSPRRVIPRLLHWSTLLPIGCALMLGARTLGADGLLYWTLLGFSLLGAVITAVHHTEVVAHRIGEPLGTLVLALTITMIEVALIVSLMISAESAASTLARDTVFASIMLILTGLMGLCLLIGGRHHREQTFRLDGVSATLATLATITALTLVFPNFTITATGPHYSASQLSVVAVVSLLLYATFIFVQTVRHRDYFLPSGASLDDDSHAIPPSNGATLLSAGMLVVSLIIVVVTGEILAPHIESAVLFMHAPKELVGVIISSIVLMPEGYAAVRAARRNRLQTSLNLTLGSALASIGFTIPAIAIISLFSGWSLSLGLPPKETVLLALALLVSSLSLNTGRTTILQGAVHLGIFLVYLFTVIVP
jgi:Ca2+:H+ antiporter